MDAIEFVKKYGIVAASDLWCGKFPLYENNICILNGSVCTISGDFLFDLLDIKQTIEAFSEVAKYGGLNEAKKLHYDEFRSDTTYNELQKAINLVEQCLND